MSLSVLNNSAHATQATDRLDDLAQIIRAYNDVTAKLQSSHENLQAEVVRLREQLASTDAQLQRSRRLAALGEMAAGIAHEIRNPLAAIQLYADLLAADLANLSTVREAADGAEGNGVLRGAGDTARKIVEAVRGLDAIVRDVLTFARDFTPRPVEADIAAILHRAVEGQRPLLVRAGVTAVVIPAHPERIENSLRVWGDPRLLQQAIANLIRNAVEAIAPAAVEAETMDASGSPRESPPGGKVELSARSDDDWVIVRVRDSGPGIAAEHIDRIFNPFFTTRNAGTGLGLAIVHRIVDAHGGAISVHNDAGAVFELALPRAGVEVSSRPRGRADASHLIGSAA